MNSAPAKLGVSFLVAAVALAAMMVFATGCASEAYSRNVEITHWYDDETVVIIYTRKQTQGGPRAMLGTHPETVHARICTIQDDNTMECKDQRRPTNMLNPHVYDDNVDLGDRWRP